jgi:hypothetical protein
MSYVCRKEAPGSQHRSASGSRLLDLEQDRLLDVVADRTRAAVDRWLGARTRDRLARITTVALYRIPKLLLTACRAAHPAGWARLRPGWPPLILVVRWQPPGRARSRIGRQEPLTAQRGKPTRAQAVNRSSSALRFGSSIAHPSHDRRTGRGWRSPAGYGDTAALP